MVTGAGGMLAHAVVPELERGGHAVLPLRKRDADVTRPDALRHPIATFRPDWIFHLAAFTRVDDCEADADQAHRVNALGARHVACAARDANAAMLLVSTDYVFGGDARRPYREYDVAGPRSVYAASKWAGEQCVRELLPRHLVVRTAWLFGPGGTNFVDTIRRRAAEGKPLAVVDDQRGSPTYTADLAPALVQLADQGQVGTFHVTNAGDATWHEVAVRIVQKVGAGVEVAATTTAALARPAPRPAYSVLSNQLYEETTGSRMPSWQDAVDRYLESRRGA
jgi:dTDP-4-dehydrorhamnose reductase